MTFPTSELPDATPSDKREAEIRMDWQSEPDERARRAGGDGDGGAFELLPMHLDCLARTG